jgi:hypothetical protein
VFTHRACVIVLVIDRHFIVFCASLNVLNSSAFFRCLYVFLRLN